ncbi:UdgX family uracil-DNA binding protein [Nocardioides flavescens]|uniref:Type-4 uracil-DNA glycosylase n=1 Tax=Nocardioides flavescens TaxID=2691959 RepID=A0A6L7EYT6_9ACTN|nr:UdgX family uracil-DNA binding protein [Nocardioides flavescens]MXG89409.1 UdgX family uracil-DNA binding protein [Nocardioides flavescens]
MTSPAATPDRPGAQQWVPEHPSLETLQEAAQGCHGCELYADATQTVMGRGAPDARLVLLGEQPGDQEDKRGEPFVGPAGRVLVSALDDAGIDRGGVYRTNVVKHFRWQARGKQRIHQSPAQAHVAACTPWLAAEMALLRPVGVVLLGGTAGKALYGTSFRVGESRGTMTAWPGERMPVPAPPQWVLPTLHPSAVLRADDRDAAYDGLVADLRIAAQALAA